MGSLTKKLFLVFLLFYIFCATYAPSSTDTFEDNRSLGEDLIDTDVYHDIDDQPFNDNAVTTSSSSREPVTKDECLVNVTKVFKSPDPKENLLYAYLNYSDDQFYGSEEFSVEAFGYFSNLLHTLLDSDKPKELEVWSPLMFCGIKYKDIMYSCVDYIAKANGLSGISNATESGAGAFYIMYHFMTERKLTLENLFPNWSPKYDNNESLVTKKEDQKYWREFWERKVSVVKEYFYLLHNQVILKNFYKLKTPMQYCGF